MAPLREGKDNPKFENVFQSRVESRPQYWLSLWTATFFLPLVASCESAQCWCSTAGSFMRFCNALCKHFTFNSSSQFGSLTFCVWKAGVGNEKWSVSFGSSALVPHILRLMSTDRHQKEQNDWTCWNMHVCTWTGLGQEMSKWIVLCSMLFTCKLTFSSLKVTQVQLHLPLMLLSLSEEYLLFYPPHHPAPLSPPVY